VTSSRAGALVALAIWGAAALAAGTALVVRSAGREVIRVTSEPAGAALFVDGRFAGVTPTELVDVGPGPHALRFEKDGFVTLTTRLAPDAAGEPVVSQALSPVAQGTLEVASRPAGGEVFLDGQFRGVTPLTLAGVRAGAHVLRIEKTNHSPWSGSVLVRDGETTAASCELEDRVLEFLKRTVAENPDDISRRIELGHYYIVVSEPERAAQTYAGARALAQKPGASREDRDRLEKQIRKDMMSKGRLGERFRAAMQAATVPTSEAPRDGEPGRWPAGAGARPGAQAAR